MRWSSRPLLVVLLFTTSTLAGCIFADDADPTLLDADDAIEPTALTAYLHDLTPLDETMNVVDQLQDHLRVETPTGIELDTWIIRPDTDEPVPLVLEVTPYYSGGSIIRTSVNVNTGQVETYHVLGPRGEELVRRGYAVGISSVRGTGTSDGCFTQGGISEAKDTAALIESLAKEPWSNGNVGLIGVSYPGTTPQDVWIEAPPSLKTVIPIAGISDFYKYNFVNGVPIVIQGFAFNTYYWAFEGPTPNGAGAQNLAAPQDLIPAVTGEACTDQLLVQEGGISSTLDGNKDGYWQERDFVAELLADWDRNHERASVFYIHGLQDWNVKPHMMEDWLPLIQETGVPYKVMLGQWAHAWPQREDWWNTTMVAWFEQFLKGIDTGILDAPPVQVQSDDGIWRHETHWPPLDTTTLTLHPHEDGTLHANPAESGRASYHDHRGKLLTTLGAFADVTDGDRDPATEGAAALETQAYPATDRVLFRSEPMTMNTTIAGQPRFAAIVTAESDKAALMLTLAEELEDGTLRHMNYAAISLNHVEDLSNGRASVAGIEQSVDVRFFPQDDVVEAGSRIVLIAAGNLVGDDRGPSLQPIVDGGWIHIDLADARLDLPVDTTITHEDPQPCWEGWELDDNREPIPGTCYWLQ